MVGGSRAAVGEESSLSFVLYCCYRFSIWKKDGPPYITRNFYESLPQSRRVPAETSAALVLLITKCDTVQ